MKKTFKVVMLPTNKETNIFINTLSNKLSIINNKNSLLKCHKSQHLYVLSDEEIKEGDWYIYSQDGTSEIRQDKKDAHGICTCKKIVATTDKSLTIKSNYKIDYVDSLSKVDEQLPQLPESFIQAYIKAYNDCKPITEVDLEMDIVGASTTDGAIIDIKTRPDNTIIVHQSKMYSRDEVVKLLQDCAIHFGIIEIPKNDGKALEQINNWIKYKI